MLAKEIMITKIPLVGPDASLKEVARKMLTMETAHVLVVDEQERLLGLICGHDLCAAVADVCCDCSAAEVMVPRARLLVAFPDTPVEEVAKMLTEHGVSQLPVVEGDVLVGYVDMAVVLSATAAKVRETRDMLEQFRQATMLIEVMRESLVVVDKDFVIREFNPAAERASGLTAGQMIGRQSKTYRASDSAVRKVMESGAPLYNVEMQNKKGQVFLTNNVPIIVDGQIAGVLQTSTETTEMKELHFQLLKARDELDKAFALTLPDSRVEQKLKHTPEYRDVFDRATGMIEVTEVIEDGGYLHVVNALKVAADLNEKGVMSLLGVDKDTLVQSLIFHDLGKSQPVLYVGQLADPLKVFEESTRHAARSADIIESYYSKHQNVVTLIRYHHHREEELPADFPQHLLPMLRLFKIIDGLSAGLTRRNARVGFRLSGSRLTVLEHNVHPEYNRTAEMDLYNGQEWIYAMKNISP